ncbi:MAG: endopeptidase La [Clostridia bacterium]|nr:endopeptidase La [Clostridia bacterium]
MEQMNQDMKMMTLPVILLKNDLLLPFAEATLETEERPMIAAALEAEAMGGLVLVVPEPDSDDLSEALSGCVGTVSEVGEVKTQQGPRVSIALEGYQRCEIISVTSGKHFATATVIMHPDPEGEAGGEDEFLRREVLTLFQECVKYLGKGKEHIASRVSRCKSLGETVDCVAAILLARLRDKVDILEEIDPRRRAEVICFKLQRDLKLLGNEIGIHQKVKERMDDHQRQYYMREQIKVLQEELGEDEGQDEEIVEYMKRILTANLPEAVTEKLVKETNKLSKMPYASAESTVIRGYIDTCLELPWHEKTKDRLELSSARKILDKEHWGLQEVKERILEFLAVQKLTDRQKSQILCFVGAPGVGKTSVASSIAHAMNRKFVRVALGGVRDESDIRGHRKTYIGSMPGRIMNAMIDAGVQNPVILLDEIDKLTRDSHGDPSSALLEVLDPDQNKAFRDHFIELPFDLSDCLFIATANTLDTISRPLLDRMEIIELKTYTRSEKLAIAKGHLVPKVLDKNGLTKKQVRFRDEAIFEVIDHYTREAGVRNLERELSSICRKIAAKKVEEAEKEEETKSRIVTVTAKDIKTYLGAPKIIDDPVLTEDEVGVVNGLAYTEVGGELLRVESAMMEGTGKLELTGSLGDVMKESAKIALSIARVRADKYHLPSDFYKTKDIHVHFPEGAVPKDGPSAGVTLVTSLISRLSGIPVRHDIAMTGEVTLSGRVFAIGGLREKTMAAYKSGIRRVLIPADNAKDLERLEDYIKNDIDFILCKTVDDVLDNALVKTSDEKALHTPVIYDCKVKRSSHETEYRADNT